MSSVTYKNLTECSAFSRLSSLPAADTSAIDADRVRSSEIPLSAGLVFNYGASPIGSSHIQAFQELAEEQLVVAKYRALVSGDVMNTGEQRMVLHHLLRGQLGGKVAFNDTDLRTFYLNQTERFSSFAERVHKGEIVGSTGKRFTTVVQIGIGGSDLGPRALHLALQEYVIATGGKTEMEALFVSNVDPDDAASVIRRIDAEETLFVLVSKSGTTQETLTNERFVADLAAKSSPSFDIRKHMVAVTSQTSPLAGSSDYLDAFFIDDFIGGRYSATSAVGGVVLSLAFGPDVFQEILDGAHEADTAAMEESISGNATLLDAMIGLYERNVLGYATTAVLPYSQALHRFPAHLQQLDMESNGKGVNRIGQPIDYETGPIVFGEPGTNGQHSFYQLLHQGTTVVPLQFVGFRASQIGSDIDFEGSTSQVKLNANLAAQIVAFAAGKSDPNPNKQFNGGRPSTLIHGDRLTPRALGALLAHFENKVMFQGFLWNVNSFDQEGVQLGKVLTKKVLAGESTGALLAYADLLGVKKTRGK